MQRRQLLAGMGATIPTTVAGCIGGSGGDDGNNADPVTPTESNGTPHGDDGESATVNGPDIGGDATITTDDYTCSRRNENEFILEDGVITVEGELDMYNWGCIEVEADASWNPNGDGSLIGEIELTTTEVDGECPECDRPESVHLPFTWTMPAPETDYWTGGMALVRIDPDEKGQSTIQAERDFGP